jgi:hypothetical protein
MRRKQVHDERIKRIEADVQMLKDSRERRREKLEGEMDEINQDLKNPILMGDQSRQDRQKKLLKEVEEDEQRRRERQELLRLESDAKLDKLKLENQSRLLEGEKRAREERDTRERLDRQRFDGAKTIEDMKRQQADNDHRRRVHSVSSSASVTLENC